MWVDLKCLIAENVRICVSVLIMFGGISPMITISAERCKNILTDKLCGHLQIGVLCVSLVQMQKLSFCIFLQQDAETQ